jgi:hypothetical protein
MADKAPYLQTIKATMPATAQGATADMTIGEAPFAGTVTAISYTPEANITGDDTNSRTLTVVNKGLDGNGTTVVGTLAFTTGINGTDFNEQAFTLSEVEDATTVAEGDILALVSTAVASGLADPGGLVQVTISRS